MKEGKLIQFLSKIEESELKSLIKFAKSPYHNTNKLLVPLLQKILTYYPDFEHKKLTKEHLFHSIHPAGKSYHEGRMNLLMTNLVSLVQDFFMYQEFQQDKIAQRRFKGKAFSNRNMYRYYKKEVEGVLEDLEQSPYREEEYFFQRFDVEQEFFFHFDTPKNHSESALFIYNSMDALDKFYMTAKIKLSAEQITMAKRLNTSTDISLLEIVLSNVEEKQKIPIVLDVYKKMLKIRLDENSREYYEDVKNILFSSYHHMEYKTQKFVFGNLTNYLIGQLNRGNNEVLLELLDLYKFGLKQDYVIENDKMPATKYSSISLISVNAGEFEWSYNFINEYEKFLPEEDAHLAKLMALAFWNYRKGAEGDYLFFYKTLELLRELNFNKKNIFHFIRSRLLWIRASYELLKYDSSYYSTLVDYIKSFEIQLRKDQILSLEVKKRYFSFIFCVKKIIKFSKKIDKSKIELEKLEEEIGTQKRIALKNWVLEKVEEFENELLQ